MNELAHVLAQTRAHVQEDDLAALRGIFQQGEQPSIYVSRSISEAQFQKAELAQARVRMDLPSAVSLECVISTQISKHLSSAASIHPLWCV